MSKVTIGCRVEESELKEIDLTCQQLGQSRSDWLYGLIREALGKAPALTAKSLATRVKALEDRLARLAR